MITKIMNLVALLKLIKNSKKQKKIYLLKLIQLTLFLKKNNLKRINLLKMDTQGYEEPILRGARKIITEQKIDLIELEIILGDYYEKSSSFKKIEDALSYGSYRLLALDRRPNVFENSKLYFNALYSSKNIYKKLFI